MIEDFDPNYNPQFDTELRLYSFVNFYLSSIQQGIQTGHAAVDLVTKYLLNGNPFNTEITEEKTNIVASWASTYKTFIVLNGGDNAGIKRLFSIFVKSKYPWCPFHESEDALGGLMTTFSVILPDYVFNLQRSKNIRDEIVYSWIRECDDGGCIIYSVNKDDPEFELVHALKSCGLAK